MAPAWKNAKALKTKNIKARTGAKAQSKQISALSTKVTKLTKINFARVRTVWQKGNQTINMSSSDVAAGTPYMCPIPYAPCIITGDNVAQVEQARFQDNNLGADRIIDKDGYGKRFIFGIPQAALNSNLGYHTGGTLKYQFILQGDFATATVARFQKIGLYLIKPKKALADQLTKERELRIRRPLALPPFLVYGGGSARLIRDKDYIAHDGESSDSDMVTSYGSMINTKYWTVVSKRDVSLSHPGASNVSNNANANNTSPANNALTAAGSISLPAGGELKNVTPVISGALVEHDTQNVLEMTMADQVNENSVYLVCIHNVPRDDSQIRNGLSLGFIVEDRYKIVV
ncbi:MAG: hypothetical protein [Circular genetic element sp.]|nr:MAG: hypothetical protein [Circular genetic element sp.]